MLKCQRLGVILEPKGGKNGRFAKFIAGMVRSGDIVHMLYTKRRGRFCRYFYKSFDAFEIFTSIYH